MIGLLHIKDFIRASRLGSSLDLADLVRPLRPCRRPRPLRSSSIGSSAIEPTAASSVDDTGATLGFVTLDDVIAEVMDEDADSDVSC